MRGDEALTGTEMDVFGNARLSGHTPPRGSGAVGVAEQVRDVGRR
ncbi:MAG TPA: hypothetical protein VE198_05870 [Actinoallomurus sp.]|nr:hypothetical protein [Actinoallomurus sp.]